VSVLRAYGILTPSSTTSCSARRGPFEARTRIRNQAWRSHRTQRKTWNVTGRTLHVSGGCFTP